jgi:hypothetical protein
MAKTITKVLAACACSLLLASLATPPGDSFIDSAVAKEGGGGGHGGGNGGGHGGGNGGGHGGGRAGGDHGGIGQGAGLGAGHAKSEAGANNASANGLAHRNDSQGNATSAAARSKETTGLAKAMSVVSTTAASVAAALGLQNAFDQQARHDAEDDVDAVDDVADVDEPDTTPTP